MSTEHAPCLFCQRTYTSIFQDEKDKLCKRCKTKTKKCSTCKTRGSWARFKGSEEPIFKTRDSRDCVVCDRKLSQHIRKQHEREEEKLQKREKTLENEFLGENKFSLLQQLKD